MSTTCLDFAEIRFPNPELALENGLLAYGGNVEPQTMLKAYQSGIFPWYSKGDAILWWSPDPRCIFEVGALKVSKSLSKVVKSNCFEVRIDTDFEAVVGQCQKINREGQEGSWIDEALFQTFCRLHEMGFAHSVECWQQGRLVGGLFGMALGGCFFGESMFSAVSNASKVALVALDRYVQAHSFLIIDCQFHTEHLESLGAKLIPRKVFLDTLEIARQKPSLPWQKGTFVFG